MKASIPQALLFCGLTMWLQTGMADAAPLACPTAPYRWQDDCSDLKGQTLTGIDKLKYIPFGDDGWVTLGGEARVRSEILDAINFGVGAKPEFYEIGARGLLGADIHFTPRARIFGQLGAVDESGRLDRRSSDRDRLDLFQLFADIPAPLPGGGELTVRLGRQELEVSGNRLVSTRDGIVVRRAFQGVMLIAERGDFRASAFHTRPMEPHPGVFDDHFNHIETFDGVTTDMPAPLKTRLNLFAFHRQNSDADYRDFVGIDRRWSVGVRMLTDAGPLFIDTQATVQWGKTAAGQPIRAYGGGSILTYTFDAPHMPRMVTSLLYASGDKQAGDGKLQTFDPLYPSNYGLSAAPILYPTNFGLVGTQGLLRFGATDVGLAGFYVRRASTHDTAYGMRASIPGTDNLGATTAWLIQANTRTPVNDRTDFTFALVHALAGDNIKTAGGHDSTYLRLDIATRF